MANRILASVSLANEPIGIAEQIIEVLVIMIGCSDSGKEEGWMKMQIIKVLVIMSGCSESGKKVVYDNAKCRSSWGGCSESRKDGVDDNANN